MYFFLILFFISLSGIVLMIGKKLIFADIKKGEDAEKFILETFNLDEIKHIAISNVKKYGFIALVIILRFSIKSSHFLKSGYGEIKNKMRSVIKNYLTHKEKEPKEKEASNFLKMVLDYKNKIRKIKHKIKEEEGIE
ncbi:MAG: hypothetical protein AAB493_02105 [Patescibacteria group bacterium]